MNEVIERSILRRVLLRPNSPLKTWAGATCVLLGLIVISFGCSSNQPAEKALPSSIPAEQPQTAQPPAPSIPQPTEVNPPTVTAPEPLEGSGRMVWAKGLAGYF